MGGIITGVFDRYSVGTLDSNNLTVDPLFEDAGNNNFRLQSTSPAIDSGINLDFLPNAATEMTRDYEGTAIPRGNGFDIGAIEY